MGMRYFQYLTRSIAEGQKKSVAEWNTLIKMSLSEIDDMIKGSNVSSSVTTYSFDEYRRELERIAISRGVEIPPQAREPQPERKDRGPSKNKLRVIA